jgi:hypothetical protein
MMSLDSMTLTLFLTISLVEAYFKVYTFTAISRSNSGLSDILHTAVKINNKHFKIDVYDKALTGLYVLYLTSSVPGFPSGSIWAK